MNVASFCDFKWPAELDAFSDTNVILGWNGTGKTVISRVLRSFEKGEFVEIPDDSEFQVMINDATVLQKNLKGHEKTVRVFNEDYIRDVIGQGSLPYVVYVGEAPKDFAEKEEEVSKLRIELAKIECKDTHGDIAEEVAREIRRIDGIANINKDLEGGFYDSYYKTSFEKRIEFLKSKIADGSNIDEFKFSEPDLKSLKVQLSSEESQKKEYSLVKKWDDWLSENLNDLNKTFSATPVHELSERIENFKADGEIYGWIRKGVEVHELANKKAKRTVCLFCNSAISNANELLKHFTDDVIKLNADVKDGLKKANSSIKELSGVEGSYRAVAENLRMDFEAIRELLMKKEDAITEKVEDFTFTSRLIGQENILEPLKDVAHKIEIHYVAEAFDRYTKNKEGYDACRNRKQSTEQAINLGAIELAKLKAQAKNVHEPAEKLSELLRVTFPHKELELRDTVDGIGYEIYRKGEKCELPSLSEGERNFLALAYFISSLNTQDTESKIDENALVVIDDPVSSLDKDSIFQIFSIIACEMQNKPERQYVLLTHNLDFYSHLCLHLNKRESEEDSTESKTSFYQVVFDSEGSKLEDIHPMLRNFKSDYQYSASLLWQKKDSKEISDAYHTVNLLRRVWETLLHFKYGQGDFKGKLRKAYNCALAAKLDSMSAAPQSVRDSEKRTFNEEFLAMYRFVNYGSHEFTSTETFDVSILNDADRRINNFFKILRLIDRDHYDHIIK